MNSTGIVSIQVAFFTLRIETIPLLFMETTHKLKTVAQSRETIELNDSLHEPRADLQVLRLTRQGGSRKLDHFRPLRNLRLVLPIAFRQIIICPARFAYLVVDSGILEVFACWVVAG